MNVQQRTGNEDSKIITGTHFVTGEMIAEKDKCKECKGRKVTQETKIIEVHVDKGMQNGQKIPFRGEGDQMVGNLFY